MPGEAYVQIILNHLNNIRVCGEENIKHMIAAMDMLKALRNDIMEHKTPDVPAAKDSAGNV